MGLQPQGDGGEGVRQEVDEQQVHRREGHRQGQQGGVEHRQDPRQVAGEEELDGAADVGIEVAAVLHRVDDGGEVVVSEDHAGGVLGHLGAGDAHGHADVRLFQGGGVVDPVPGHGHHPAPLLPGLDDAHFVLRRHPGEDGEPFNVLLQQLLGHKVQLRPGHGPVPRSGDAQLLGHG